MLSAREVGLVAQRELLRNLRSTKGIAMAALFFLGGLVPSVIRMLLARATEGTGVERLTDEDRRALFQQVLERQYHDAGIAKHLSDAPLILYGLFAGTLTFLPFFILVIGFDQIAREIQHRTIRYSAGRASRPAIVVGKALGTWGVIAVMTLVLHVTVWIIALAQREGHAANILSWGARLWVFNVMAAASYVGFTTLMSSLVRTPIVALFLGVGIGFGLWLGYTILTLIESTKAAGWAFPNGYERLLISPDPLHVAGGMALLVAWGAACVAGASVIVVKRDV
jgi:ABC-type transport system involved in multi-copper enzyme maturation permease subunit